MLKTSQITGVPVIAGTVPTVAKTIIQMVRDQQWSYVCVATVHMITTASRNEKMMRILEEARLVTTDGMPLVWLLWQQGRVHAGRVTGTDLTLELCRMAADDGIPVYFYGCSSNTIRLMQQTLARRFPHLKVAGMEFAPLLPDQPDLDTAVVERIKASGARITFIGLGCPKQEFWMATHAPQLPTVTVGVGAAFDFIAGTKRRPPVWIQNAGLEWLFRLIAEPRRLGKRYLVSNTQFLFDLLGGWLPFMQLRNSNDT